jgi:hypothetical protein
LDSSRTFRVHRSLTWWSAAEGAATSVGLGIIVSPFVYETAIEQASDLIDADEYKMTEVSNKEFRSPAWVRLVDLAPPPLRGPLRPESSLA